MADLERQVRRPHHLTHEIGGADTVRPHVRDDGADTTGRQRTLNFVAPITVSEDTTNQEYDIGLATSALDFGEVGDITSIDTGDSAAAGTTGEVADAGHQHAIGTIISDHTGAADPHTGYQLESEVTVDTFTPVATFSGGNGTRAHSVQVGSLRKEGKRVHIQGRIDFTKGTASGDLTITGLTHAATGTTNNFSTILLRIDGAGAGVAAVSSYIAPSGQAINVEKYAAGAPAALTAADLAASTVVIFSGTYETA